MKVSYKNCVYRTENLTEEQKKLMSKEIEKAEMKAEKLKIKPIEKEKLKSYKKEDKQ